MVSVLPGSGTYSGSKFTELFVASYSQMRELKTAGEAARVGGEVLMKYFQTGLIADHKSDAETYNLVSVADVEAEQAIVGVIRREFPDHAVLGEESHHGDVKSELKRVTWPGKAEVYGTTAVVIVTVIFFGVYLFAVDIVLRNAVEWLFGAFR